MKIEGVDFNILNFVPWIIAGIIYLIIKYPPKDWGARNNNPGKTQKLNSATTDLAKLREAFKICRDTSKERHEKTHEKIGALDGKLDKINDICIEIRTFSRTHEKRLDRLENKANKGG